MPILKNSWYRISGTIVAENDRSFMYPTHFDDDCFTGRNPMKCRNVPIYVMHVDFELDDIPHGTGRKAYPYIAGIVQGYNSTVYIASGNAGMFDRF